MRRGLALLALVVLAGCGDGDGDGVLTVSAASSLKPAFERVGSDARFSFGGSDELAAQIRQGARPDVYAAANTKLPEALHAEGLVEAPVEIAANRLVLAVPARSTAVRSVADLERPGLDLVVGAASVPVGSYTREVLQHLGRGPAQRILANVRSNEPDVAGVVGKLVQGAADAGFVYLTDVRAARGALRAIDLPARLRPAVTYGAAVVRGAEHADAARAFLAGLRRGPGRDALVAAGFERP